MFVSPGVQVYPLLRVLMLTLWGIVWMPPPLANAEEYVLGVDPIDPTKTEGDFESIQTALDAAVDGDVIILGAGTYQVNLNFPRKVITLLCG